MALSKIVADSVGSNAVTTAALSDSGVTAGSYGNTTAIPVITVDAKGRITSATTNAVSGVTGFSYTGANNTFTVAAGATSFSANIAANTLSDALTDTGVTAGAYGNTTAIPNITVDAKGRITSATTSSVSGVTGVSYTSANNTLTVSTSTTNFTANIQAGLDQAYSNAVSVAATDASTKAATAYTNAVSTAATDASTKAATAYSNATSVAATDASTKAATAYTNAVAYAASNSYVNTTFAPKAGPTFTGTAAFADVTISGNLTTSGTTTYINTTNLTVGDNIITLNADLGASAPTENAGIEINRGTSANVALRWYEATDEWQTTVDGTNYLKLATNTDVSTAYSNAITYSGNAALAYANAVTYAGTIAATAYSNATSTAATDASTKAATAYSNAIAYAAANSYVNTQLGLKANLSGATFTGPIVSSSSLTANGTGSVVSVATEQEWGYRLRMVSNTTTNRATFLTQRSLGTTASPTTVTSGTLLGGLSVGGYDGTSWRYGYDGGAEIHGVAAENWTTSVRGTHITFSTTAQGAGSLGERVRIAANGQVGIGNTTPVYTLSVGGTVWTPAGDPGTGGLFIHVNSGVTVSGNKMNLFTSQLNGWSFNNNANGYVGNTALSIDLSGNLAATGKYYANTPFYENATAITANYTVAANTNAMSAGPITIADGVTVTVSDGSTWTVV